MRTTLTLDDDIATALKEAAYRTGRSFKAAVNETLRTGLMVVDAAPKPKAYRLKPSSLGEVLPGVNLDKALQLANALEDEDIAHKLELRN
jgi:plasmid stability protein